jgi:hypothetical protein
MITGYSKTIVKLRDGTELPLAKLLGPLPDELKPLCQKLKPRVEKLNETSVKGYFEIGQVIQKELVGIKSELARNGHSSYGRHLFEYLGMELDIHERTLHDCHRVIVMAGAVPGIVEVLRQHGHRVSVQDHRQWPPRCVRTNRHLLEKLTGPEQRLVEAVTMNHLGQIVVHGQAEMVRAIEIICRRWPGAIVLVPVATKRRVDELHDALAVPLRGTVSKAHGGTWASNCNRIVCTYRSLETVYADSVDVVIFTEPDSMLNAKVFRAIADLPGEILRYAVVRADEQLDLASQVRLESLCGPVLWRSPDPRGEPAAVRVMVCEGPHLPTIACDGALDRKQRAIWHNFPRNQMIAEIASALFA